MQILPVNSTTGLLSVLLAHLARKVLFSLAKRKLLLAPGVGLVDFSSSGDDDVCHFHKTLN